MEENLDNGVPTLHFLAMRAASVQLFKANVGRYKISSASNIIKDYVKFRVPIPRKMREKMQETLTETFKDVHRWWEKNAEIFPENKAKARRSEHLVLFFDCLGNDVVFSQEDMTVDDDATARKIIEANENWPQLQFQFACAYAMVDLLKAFDKIRLRVFRKRLTDHPLYDFWHVVLADKEFGESLYDTEGLSPNQTVSLVFQWALQNGFKELVVYLWSKVTLPQREYVGILQWRRLCVSAKHGPMFHFLCEELCEINDNGTTRITWQYFYDSLIKIINEPKPGVLKDLHYYRLKFIMKYACPKLRTALLKAQNYRALQLTMQCKDMRTFYMLQGHLTPDQLGDACIYLEAVGGSDPNNLIEARRVIAQRQWSIG